MKKVMLVFGTGLGIATNLASTKNRAAPIPMATIVFTDRFFIAFLPLMLAHYKLLLVLV